IQQLLLAGSVSRPRRKRLDPGEKFYRNRKVFPAWRATISHLLRVDAEFIGGAAEA
ncbi:hypothetical protein N0V82_010004, partial [Gnomoniopsis sp. IMI 355080]